MTSPRRVDPLLTVAELADELRLSGNALYNWRAAGIGPRSMKFGRRVVYKRSDVDAWLTYNEQRTARGGV